MTKIKYSNDSIMYLAAIAVLLIVYLFFSRSGSPVSAGY